MSGLALKQKWLERGAKIVELPMCEYVAEVSGTERELAALRGSVAVSDMSHLKKLSFDEAEGADFLDAKLAANMLKLRYGKALETFLANGDGKPAADITAANIDDKIFVFAESIDDGVFAELESGGSARNLDPTHTLLSVDGPDAWKVLKKLFGADIYNLSFMSVEKYCYAGADAVVLRAGKTGEFGYQILVPNEVAPALFDELEKLAAELGGGLAGAKTLLAARAKGNFFNIYAEGKTARNAVELGLQYQIDFDKESFCGSEAIFAARQNCPRKLVAVSAQKPIEAGAKLFDEGRQVAEIANVDETDPTFALAFADSGIAFVGVKLADAPNGECAYRIVSRPAVLTQSLLRGMD